MLRVTKVWLRWLAASGAGPNRKGDDFSTSAWAPNTATAKAARTRHGAADG
ncbi:MAG: hypothetical protein ABI893_12020 [Polaromonas sp.]|uniref:hypothetical protein n=1 Tax=Polaromonas sp. TaxID=1869339 RepID=UPI00326572A1